MKNTRPQERTIESLDDRILGQFEKASQALESNVDYTIELCSEWIRRYPEIVDFRRLLRDAQIRKHYPSNEFNTGSSWTSGLRSILGTGDKDPLKAILKCEKVLAEDPIDIRANENLASQAAKLGWKKTQVFALQTLLTNPKRKPSHVIRLVEMLIEDKETEFALKVCETFLRAFPENPEILDIRNQASINQSIQRAET
jgi:hypothetical protein